MSTPKKKSVSTKATPEPEPIVEPAVEPEPEPVAKTVKLNGEQASLCYRCIHKHIGLPTCDAFLEIPARFLDGSEQHLQSVLGDDGIVYQAL